MSEKKVKLRRQQRVQQSGNKIMRADGQDMAELLIAKIVSEALMKFYPGYQWLVSAQFSACNDEWSKPEGGIVSIQLAGQTGEQGYNLQMSAITEAGKQNLRPIMIAGGEILERYRLNRGKANQDQVRMAPKDFQGNLIGDIE